MAAASPTGDQVSVFTQCLKCETIFRLSAETLRVAGGQVRCGRCGEVFNALARLAEDASGFTKGESPLDLETRAEEILEATDSHAALHEPGSVEAAAPLDEPPHVEEPPPGVEIAQLQILDPLGDDPSLEFTLPPGELDRIFIETRPSSLQRLAAEGHRGETPRLAPMSGEQSGEPVSETFSPVPPTPVAPVLVFSAAVPPAPHPESLAVESAPRAAAPIAAAPGGATHEPPAPSRFSGLEISDTVRQDMLSNYARAQPLEIDESRRRLPRAAWIGAALALVLLLAAQLVHSNGEWLATHVPLLGGRAAASNLSAYQLRQWGVTGDPAAKGTLRVRASILNDAAQLQPYPLLRVTLANRFGTRVGTREFEPTEYLGKPMARLLAPGEQADATLDILDPGQDAESFEIDVCVRNTDKKIVCTGDAAAQPH